MDFIYDLLSGRASPEAVMITTLILLMVVVMVTVFSILVHAGLFYTIHVYTKTPEIGELTVMYKSGRGAYSQSGALYSEAHSLLPEYNTIGVYYDDPEKKDVDNLRYIVGLVLAEGKDEPNKEHEDLMLKNGFKKTVFPKINTAVCSDFPFKSTLSCILSVFRMYPALRDYVEARELCAHPFIEIYHNASKRILFIGPLEQQDSFNVPEVVEDPILSGNEEDSYNEDSCDDDSVNDSVKQNDSDDESKSESVANTEGTWEKSASVVEDDGEESDTNTASSFEEIDAKETEEQKLEEKDE